jgi:hypothetical protein
MATLHGTCLCGGIRFEVDADPETLRFCHCTSCKHLSGGGGTVNFGVPPSAIRIVAGEGLIQTFTPDGGSAKTFCRTCGANLFGGGWPDSPKVQRPRHDDRGSDRRRDRRPSLRPLARAVGDVARRRGRAVRDD